MSYAFYVFDVDAFAPRSVYLLNGDARPHGADCIYTSDDLDAIVAEADRASRTYSPHQAHYAVFDVGADADTARGLVVTSRPWETFGVPVYVPLACSALSDRYGWAFALGRAVLPVIATAPVAAPAPAPIPCWPLDTERGQIELEDGTPCRVVTTDFNFHQGPMVLLEVERTPTGPATYPGAGRWWHNINDGTWQGGGYDLRARNVGGILPSLVPLDDVEDDTPAAAAPAAAPLPPRFEVRSGLNGTDRDNWGTVAEFDSGKDAGAWVGRNKAAYQANGKSLVIVKVEPSAAVVDWRERERARLADGTYARLPKDWAERIARDYPDHFPHVASSNKLKVAFTESEGSGERDKQKVLSAAEYAERFFGNGYQEGPFWGRTTRLEFVSDMLGASIKPAIAPLGDARAMVRVYRDTRGDGGRASGCMSYQTSDYATDGVHPTVVYAKGGELSVAILRGYGDEAPEGSGYYDINPDAEWDSSGPVLARALVWIKDGENKEYGRVYGEGSDPRTLRTALEAMGFKAGECIGARIAKVPCGSDYIMPYLDIGHGSVTDHGDHFTAGGHEIDAQRTDGLLGYTRATCDHCEDDCDEDDLRTVYVTEHDTENWCEHCRDYSAFYCEQDDEWTHDEHAVEYYPAGRNYTRTVARWHIEGGSISVVETDSGDLHEDGFYCDDCGSGFSGDDLNVWDGDRDTGVPGHADGDSLCEDCHAERSEAADALEAEAAEAAEAADAEDADADTNSLPAAA